MKAETKLCKAKVEERDTYRVNRGPGPHFKLHYTLRQCKRYARAGREYCWQHRHLEQP